MRDGSFYDELSDLNCALYERAGGFKAWKSIDIFIDKHGLYIEKFKKDNDILIAIMGTDFKTAKTAWQDIVADVALWFPKVIPAQFKTACEYVEKHKDITIVTGYSLGGSIAQMLGSKYGFETITFEAYGTSNLLHAAGSNIINFGNAYDPIFTANFNNHVGAKYIMPVKFNPIPMATHMPNSYGKPSQASKFDGDYKALMLKYGKHLEKRVQDYTRKGMLNIKQDLTNVLSPSHKNK